MLGSKYNNIKWEGHLTDDMRLVGSDKGLKDFDILSMKEVNFI